MNQEFTQNTEKRDKEIKNRQEKLRDMEERLRDSIISPLGVAEEKNSRETGGRMFEQPNVPNFPKQEKK